MQTLALHGTEYFENVKKSVKSQETRENPKNSNIEEILWSIEY